MRVYLAWDDVPKLLQIAAGEDGRHEEQGQNSGTCAVYQRAIGGEEAVQRRDSWCLYFVLWCLLDLLGHEMPALRQLVPKVTGSCEEFRKAARAKGQLLPVGTSPLPGDIGLVVHTAQDHAHHAFLVSRGHIMGHGVPTIEGNSNNTGGSNGDGTYERDARWGPADPCIHGGQNHYELVRLTDPSIPAPEWL